MFQSVDPKAMYETWEKAAGAWLDVWLKSPAFLKAMGQTLEAQLGLKAQSNRFVDGVLAAWRVPSARDVEALGERIAALEERLSRMEDERAEGAGEAELAGAAAGSERR